MTGAKWLVGAGAVVAAAGAFQAIDVTNVWAVGTVSRCGLGPGYLVALAPVGGLWFALRHAATGVGLFGRWTALLLTVLLGLAALTTRCVDTYALSYSAAMRADLKNLATVEEIALADSGHFTTRPDLPLSPGTSRLVIAVTRDGWNAAVDGLSRQTCAIYYGATAREPALVPGTPACTRPTLDVRALILGLAVLIAGALIALPGWLRLERHPVEA